MNCFHERFGPGGTLGRDNSAEVVLLPRLRSALQRLNPLLPAETINLAIEAVTRDRNTMSLVRASQEIYRLLKNEVKATYLGGRHPATTSRQARSQGIRFAG